MTNVALSQVLGVAVTEILEKMFFIDATEAGLAGNENHPEEGGVTARLIFEGNPPGWLRLELAPGAARALAADFLGEEPSELTSGKVGEVVCELANMVCGSVLSRVESTTHFRLAAPEIMTSTENMATLPATASRTFALTEGVLTVEMAMESTAWPAFEKYGS